jgi:hypothetical protein
MRKVKRLGFLREKILLISRMGPYQQVEPDKKISDIALSHLQLSQAYAYVSFISIQLKLQISIRTVYRLALPCRSKG